MNEKYIKAAEKINAAALFFACGGYHVTTFFGESRLYMGISVFFYLCDDRNMIESFMTQYEDDGDLIEFHKFEHNGKRPFYTINLTKDLS